MQPLLRITQSKRANLLTFSLYLTFLNTPILIMDGIVSMGACELAEKIRIREVTCVAAMTAYINHIDTHNTSVNAIVSRVPREELLSLAAQYDARLDVGEVLGPLAGLPMAPKDIQDTKGLITSAGSTIYQCNVATEDSLMVQRLRNAGAIFIGKTNIPEFCLGSQTYNKVFGATRNAYDDTKTCGGSSGGAAVALAMRMLPIADGSDVMGSLRNPAAFSNIFGFRPSWGLVPDIGGDVFFHQLSTDGPMARSVADLVLLLSVQAGPHICSPLNLSMSLPIASSLEHNFAGCTIGYMGNYNGYLAMESELLSCCEQALSKFGALSMRVTHVCPEFNMQDLWRCWCILRSFTVGSNLISYYESASYRDELKPEARWECEQYLRLSARDVAEASKVRSEWYIELVRLLHTVDFLVLPSTQVFPFDVNLPYPSSIEGRAMDTYHRWMEVSIGATLASLPALSVPAGFNASGLAFGLQIIGRRGDDFRVLQLGYAWERITQFAGKVPPSLHKCRQYDE